MLNKTVPYYNELFKVYEKRIADFKLTTEASDLDSIWVKPDWKHIINIPRQGFKIHISARLTNAIEIFDIVVPYLLEQQIYFKAIKDISKLILLNEGMYGFTQVGKFITVYPNNEEQAVELAKVLDSLTKGFTAPIVPSDKQFSKGSIIHYRYGVNIKGDEMELYLIKPDGSLVKDDRSPLTPVPKWVKDPFKELTRQKTKDNNKLFLDRFLIVKTYRQRGKGGVYKALDFDTVFKKREKPKSCVIKEGRFGGEEEMNGTSAQERLVWEYEVLQFINRKMPGTVPTPYDLLKEDDNIYLVMEEVGENTIRDILINGAPTSELKILTWIKKICKIVAFFHEEGFILCDLSPDNIIITKSGEIRLIDLERAYREGHSPPIIPVGSPGFYPLSDVDGNYKEVKSPLRDIYAIGALLYVLLVPDWYAKLLSTNTEDKKVYWDRPHLPEKISLTSRLIIEKCMSAPMEYVNVTDIVRDIEAFFKKIKKECPSNELLVSP